jgi:hypothetical protein
VIFHSAIVFAAGTSFFVKDPRPSVVFTVFTGWGSLWGMPLLFVVSGMSACYALRHRSAAAFVGERLARLLVPFVVGLALFVVPMFYLLHLAQPGFHEPYSGFWLRFLNPADVVPGLLVRGSWGSGGVEFDPAHLWFLYCLLVFSLVLLPLFVFLRRPLGASVVAHLAAFSERHRFSALLLAAVPLALVEAFFGPDANTGGWERVSYLFPFLYGYLIASDRRFEVALQRTRPTALAGALVATTALVAWAAILGASGTDVARAVTPGWDALQALAGWAWIVAILGFALARGRRPAERAILQPPGATQSVPWWSDAAQYANQAVLPFYVLHEPVIVAAAWVITRWNAPIAVKYPLLVVVAFGATLAIYEVLVRRFRATRFLFGMKQAVPRAA